MHQRNNDDYQALQTMLNPPSAEDTPVSANPALQPELQPSLRTVHPEWRERLIVRWLYVVLAIGLTYAFWWHTQKYWAPAHPGVDQNGYLVGGRQIAKTGTAKLIPNQPGSDQLDPYGFVGGMWITADGGTPAERYYPKYPIGLPMIYAAVLRVGGDAQGVIWSYGVSPVCMTASVFGTFLLIRLFAGSFAGLCGAALLAASPVTLLLANNPNSHASSLFFVVWGMYFALSGWRYDRLWRAMLGGLLLGCAFTIRYTEGLLVLPLIAICLFKAFDRRPLAALTVFLIVMAAGYGAAVAAIDLPWLKRWFVWLPVCGLAAVAVVLLAVRRSLIPTTLRSLMPLAAWSLPVGLLLAYNQIAIGAITGYHPTGEGNDFRLEFFFDNWRNALDQLTDRGMLFVFPLAIAAMIGMFFYRWRLGLVMALWILPTIGVYMLYYWAPVSPDVGYLRFFLGTFPAIALCAAWVLTLPTRLPALRKTPDTPRPAGAIGLQLAGCATLAVLTIGAASFALHRTHWFMERDKITNTNLAARGEIIRKVIPDDSVVFVSGFMVRTPANYIQFIGDYQLYDPQEFSTRGREFTNAEDEPSWEDPHRRQARSERRSRLGRNGLREERDRLIQQALSQGRRVFVVDDGADSALAVEIGRGSLQYGRIESYKDTLPTKRRGNPERGFRVRDNRNNLRTVESATYWSIYEITQRESATLPASAMSY